MILAGKDRMTGTLDFCVIAVDTVLRVKRWI